ncbi:MAG TPA: ABC transporter permease [Actinomycetales bacterium]|nr:ABC transporter permease [Actinomycetales bacterium]
MSDALRFEWVRLTTVRSTYWLLGMAVLFPALLTLLIGLATRNEDVGPELLAGLITSGVAFFPLPLPAVLLGILGVLAVGHEYRHGTMRPTLTALPNRSALVAAKLVVIAATSFVTALVILLVDFALIAMLHGVPEFGGAAIASFAGFVVLLVLWGVLGVAATLLTRLTALVLPLLFVLPLVIEPVLQGLPFLIPALEPLQPASRFLPFTAGAQLAQPMDMAAIADEFGSAGPEPLSRAANGAVFAAFIALVLAPAWLLFEKRDA